MFTKSQESATPGGPSSSELIDEEECTDTDFVFIRKFCSVSDFMQRVRTLDNVLDSIESFTSEVASHQKKPVAAGDSASANALIDNQFEAQEEYKNDDDELQSELNICCICMDR